VINTYGLSRSFFKRVLYNDKVIGWVYKFMAKKLCLITGASAGIGAAFAEYMAQMGYDLALTARRGEKLEELAAKLSEKWGSVCIIIPADLSKPGAVDLILNEIALKGRVIDAIVNNAGYGLVGAYHNTTWSDQADFIQTLLTAPCELVHKTIGGMRARGFGRIINVASLAGYIPGGPGHTLYNAVKASLIKFSQSLNLENRDTGVHITALCPGFTYTEFHDVNGMRDSMSKMPKFVWQDAMTVVKIGFEAVEANRPTEVCGFINKAIAVFVRIIPESLAIGILAKQAHNFRGIE
jgi:uncharacterized protein